MTRVLVTGVRGTTGARVAQRLVERGGVEVWGGTSDPSAEVAHGVLPVRFSWDDPADRAAVLDGVDAVYVVRPDRAEAPELVGALMPQVPADARVVLLSERDTEHLGPHAWALRVEEVVRASPRPWTVLRPSWFMQVLTDARFYRDAVLEAGELPFPSAGASVAWIDAGDIAAVAEQALLDDRHAGRTYELTGPEAVTLPRTAALLAVALGRPVAHRDVDIDEAVSAMTGFERELSELTFARVREGRFSEVTDDVRQVLGRPARNLGDVLAGGGVRPW